MTREPTPQAELDAYLQWYFERHPVHADAMGVPGHASRLGDFTAGAYEGHEREVARWRSRLQALDGAALSAGARIDRDLVVASGSLRRFHDTLAGTGCLPLGLARRAVAVAS